MSKSISQRIEESGEFFTPLQYLLIKILVENGPMARREIVKMLKTPRTTIYDNLLELQKRRIVVKFNRNNGKRGRPLIIWKINDGTPIKNPFTGPKPKFTKNQNNKTEE